MGGFITKNCPLAIYFQFRFYKSCSCHVFYVWKTMTWIDKWPYFSISFTREPQFLKEKWSPPSSHPGDRKRLFFLFLFFMLEREDYNSKRRQCSCFSLPWRWANPFDFSKSQREGPWFLCSGSVCEFQPWISALSLPHISGVTVLVHRGLGGQPSFRAQLLCMTLPQLSQSWKSVFPPF